MKYYKSPEGDVFAFEEDGSQDDYIPSNFEPLTDEALASIRAEQEAARAPTHEQLLQSANSKRDELLAIAGLRVAPLQDAVDLEEASSEETALLKLWKKYRVEVNRAPDQPGYPEAVKWPDPPQQ